MTITALPTPPTRDDPANFASRADAFLSALPTFANEVNSDLSVIADNFSDVQTVSDNIANINAAVADLPALSAKVSKTGDTMTGHLAVPAGATGAQVPQAQEIFGNSQSWRTVTRLNNTTYTNTTGKPILVQAAAVATATNAAIGAFVNGSRAALSSYATSAVEIGFLISVPNGSTYSIDWVSWAVSSVVILEYR